MSRKNVVFSSINFVITVVYISFLLNLAIAAKPKGFSMKMIRSDSKESPLYPRYANLTQAERFRRLVEQSKARVRHLGSARAAAYNQTSSMNPNVLPFKFLKNPAVYIGEVGFGTFNNDEYKNFFLIIDTGSDHTWTQCPGGDNYFYQDAPYYDKEHSITYKRVPCDDFLSECEGERCKDGFCTYEVRYESGQITSGDLSYETLHMGTGGPGLANAVMGCGFDQRYFGRAHGVPDTYDGGRHWHAPRSPVPGPALIAGILGLGQGQLSLVLRLADYTDKRFEYCLVPYNLDSPTYLRFGSETIIGEGPEVFSTQIFKDPNFETHYYLDLLGISVNRKKLEFTQDDFKLRRDGGGTLIDSGTPLTMMMSRFYKRIEEELIDYFNGFGIGTVPGREDLETCFRIRDDFEDFPTMRFHFLGADFIIGHGERSGMFIYYKDDEEAGYTLCLALISVPDRGAEYAVNIGAVQQSNKRILYDLGEKKLSFREEECKLDS